MDRRKPSLPRQVRSSEDDDSSDEGPRTVTVARSGPVMNVSKPAPIKIPPGKISRGPYSTMMAVKKPAADSSCEESTEANTGTTKKSSSGGSQKGARCDEGEDEGSIPDSPPESEEVVQINESESEGEKTVAKKSAGPPEGLKNQEGQSSSSGTRKTKQSKQDRKRDQEQKPTPKSAQRAARKAQKSDAKKSKGHQKSAQLLGSVMDVDQAPEEIPEEEPVEMAEEQPAQMPEEQPAQKEADQPAQIPEDMPEEPASPKRMKKSE